MKILVYGAGPLGSLFAARLHAAGHVVALLARGQRLADLRTHGLVLVDSVTGQESVAHVPLVERLDPEDAYDLVLVIMRKNRALEILPGLAANQHTPNVLFLMNNAAGPGELVHALGEERVLMGFPMAAGYRRAHVVHYLAGGGPGKPAQIPIGEVDGRITPRLKVVGAALASMEGFAVDLRPDMDAWLKSHVALLMPSLAPALKAANLDNVRLAHTRDLVLLAVRAIKEGFQVLEALDVPVVPASARRLVLIPEPLLVWVLQRRLVNPLVRVALVEHAEAAEEEIRHLAEEFRALKERTTVPTPAMDRLCAYFDPATPPLPEGSAELPLDWRPVWVGLGAAAGALALVGLLSRRRKN